MNEKFEVGEIAILQNCVLHPEHNGREVEILALPRPHNWLFIDGETILAGSYVTQRHGWGGNSTRANPPQYLRKRRPPQDWVKLCNLTDLPREVTHV